MLRRACADLWRAATSPAAASSSSSSAAAAGAQPDRFAACKPAFVFVGLADRFRRAVARSAAGQQGRSRRELIPPAEGGPASALQSAQEVRPLAPLVATQSDDIWLCLLAARVSL